MFLIKYLLVLFKTLNKDVSPNEIAAGVTVGAMIGLVPKFNLLGLFLWVVLLMFRCNFGMATLSIIVFAVMGSILDPLAERLGFFLLTGVPAMRGLWTTLYNAPILPFTEFNNSLVIGQFAMGLLLSTPIFLGARSFVVAYRLRYRERVLQWRLVQVLMASKFYGLISRWMS